MMYPIDYRKRVQYERMLGREATDAIRAFPVGYLPIGCLERHGDHLPMGLDVLKAHLVCCMAAKALGGVVFPPHFYAGIHRMPAEQIAKYTGEWGNIYTDRTAGDHLVDIIGQLAIAGVRVLVLYSGHYPQCQVEMLQVVAAASAEQASITVLPFCECMIMEGDHAGISETSFLLYLDRDLVDMTRIGEVNHAEHGWQEGRFPEKASSGKGEADVQAIIVHLKARIKDAGFGD